MCQSNQQHVAKKDLFNAFQRRKGVEPLQVGHLFGGITCSHDENFSVVNKISLCTDKVKNVGKDSRLLYIFAETISGMTPAFPCFFEESNKVNIVEVKLPSLISGVVIVLVSSKISCFCCLSCR